MVGEARRTRIGGGGECRRRRSGGGRWGGDIGTTLLMLAWLGAPHSILFLLIASLLFLSFPSAIMVLVFLFVLMLLPIDQNSKLGLTLARQICKTACAYFPIHFYVEDADAFHPNLPYIFGYEPHSIWPVGIITLSSLSGLLPFPNIKGLVSNAMLKTPVMRHVWTWLGFTPATKQNFKSLLSSGYSCILIPGGAQETFYTQRGCETLFLKSRKGFVRIAMEMGAPLVPVFGFGQSNVYEWWKPSSKLYLKLSRALKFTPVFFWGYLGSFVPFQHPIYVVVGTPIQVENNPNPSEEEVAELHGRFIEALRELFEKHKERAGCVHLRLQIL